MPRPDRCLSYEGCHGTGFHNDSGDDGSGRQVRCDQCTAWQCKSVGFFDAGRGDESFTCGEEKLHEGDHIMRFGGGHFVSWRD